jgi:hypothetical protein
MMTPSTLADPDTEFRPLGPTARSPWRARDAAVWAGTAVLVAAAACSVGLAAGRRLPPLIWWDVGPDGPPEATAPLLAGLGGLYGLLAGGVAGLLRGPPGRIAAGLKGGLGFAIGGALAGGLGPLLSAATGGRLPAAGASAVACALIGGLMGLVGYTLRRWRTEHTPLPDDDWSADPTLAGRPALPAVGPGPVVRQWPVLAVSAACLVAAVVTPPSPAGWATLGVGLLGCAVAWILAGQERRLRELEQQLRQRERAGELGLGPDERPAG